MLWQDENREILYVINIKLWDLNVVFENSGENLKEDTLERLHYCGLTVLKSPMYTCELFIIKCVEYDLHGKWIRKYVQIPWIIEIKYV